MCNMQMYIGMGSLFVTRRFQNKCDIVEEPNSSGKHGIRLKFFHQIFKVQQVCQGCIMYI